MSDKVHELIMRLQAVQFATVDDRPYASSVCKDALGLINEMRLALKPFADYSKHYPKERKYGNRPSEGVLMSVASHDVGSADITVEDLHRAAELSGGLDADA